MIRYLLCFWFLLNSLFSQQSTSINAVKKIRLDNLKKNYLNQTIRFYVPGQISVIGELRDITESNFINQLNPDLVERYALPKDEIVYFCEK